MTKPSDIRKKAEQFRGLVKKLAEEPELGTELARAFSKKADVELQRLYNNAISLFNKEKDVTDDSKCGFSVNLHDRIDTEKWKSGQHSHTDANVVGFSWDVSGTYETVSNALYSSKKYQEDILKALDEVITKIIGEDKTGQKKFDISYKSHA